MPEQTDTYQLIEDYINHVLSASERAAFELRLMNDTALKQQLELHLLANELVLENRLSHLNGLIDTERTTKRTKNNLKKGLLGGLILLLIMGFVYFFQQESNTKTAETITPKPKLIAAPKLKNTPQQQLEKTNTNHPPVISTASKTAEKEIEKEASEVLPQPDVTESKYSVGYPEAEIQKASPTPIITAKNSCDSVEINFNVTGKPICNDAQNGSITVANISGGVPPFTQTIFNEYHEKANNNFLEPGNYYIQISDKNECKSELKNIQLLAIRCLSDYSISKAFGTIVTIHAFDEPITFTVLNQNGTTYYENEYDAFENIKWNGTNNESQQTEGYYLLIITTEKGEKLTGSITILP